MTRSIGYLLMGFLAAGFAGRAAFAQQIPSFQSNNASIYRYADPNDFTIAVKVWGAVSSPGIYEVREDVNLSTLLSLAGGPMAGTRTSGTTSTFTVRLYRVQTGGRYQLFTETRMQNELRILDQDPLIKNGDILITEEQTRQRFGWRDGLTILTAIATVALVVDTVIIE